MAIQERGLGRGLDSLLRSTKDLESGTRETNKLALSQLVPGKKQPRKKFDDAALQELAISLKNQGVIQPLIVRALPDSTPLRYEIVAGERRWRAAKLAGLTEVPVLIAAYTDEEAMTVSLVENLQREDLNPIEEAEALQAIRDTYTLSQEELAGKLGKSRPAVANSLRLLQLPGEIKEYVYQGKLSAGHGRTLLGIDDEGARTQLCGYILDRDLSVRDTESAVDNWKRKGRLPEELAGPKVVSGNNSRAAKPSALRDAQKRLRRLGYPGAIVNGTEDSGKVTLKYSSAGELESILNALGLAPESLD